MSRGAFALVAPTSLSSSPLPCLQHCDLASAQTRNSHDTCWRHCQHHTIVVAGTCRNCCPCPTGVCALVAQVLPTSAYPRCARIANWLLPSHDAVATCAGEASLLRSSLRSGRQGSEQRWFHCAQACNLVVIQVILVNASSCLAEMAGRRRPRYLWVRPQPWVPHLTHRRTAALQNRPR
jgi:hypothetical protein